MSTIEKVQMYLTRGFVITQPLSTVLKIEYAGNELRALDKACEALRMAEIDAEIVTRNTYGYHSRMILVHL